MIKIQKVGAIGRFLRFLVLLLGLVLVASLFTACGGEHPAPYSESSAESEGISGDRIIFCQYLSGYLHVNGDGARITELYLLYTVNADGTKPTKLLDVHRPDPRLIGFELSPDSNCVAFFSSDGYLSVLRIDTGEVTKVVEATGVGVAWSPDGSKIAYNSGGDLYVVNADGNDNKKLAEHKSARYHGEGKVVGYVSNPVWSSDGKRILFDNFTAPEFLFGGSALDVRNRRIYSVNIATTEIQVLHLSAEIRGPGPDETKIMIWACKKADERYTDGMFVMDDDGSICPGYECVLPGKWSPDGSAIASTVFDELFVLDPITCEHIAADKIEDVTDFIWSPDGQHIAYVSGDEIHIVRRDLSQGFLVYRGLGTRADEEEQHMKLKLVDWLSRE